MGFLTKDSYLVQGIDIHLHCDDHLHLLISNYFNRLFSGKKRFEMDPLDFELYLVEEPPPVPANLVPAIKTPSITSYSDGKEIHWTSNDGSIICLDPITKNAKGFLKKEILNDSLLLHSLISKYLVEALKYHGLYFLHSAALYGNGVGCLVSGDGGCGKTTTSLSLVREGFNLNDV